MTTEPDALVAELPLKSEYALLLNNLVRMQESPYYATSKADLVAAEIAITRLERERDQLRERVRGLEADARRYDRLRILGCAPAYTKHLDNGTVIRFQSLDKFIDDDLQLFASRGEAARQQGEGK